MTAFFTFLTTFLRLLSGNVSILCILCGAFRWMLSLFGELFKRAHSYVSVNSKSFKKWSWLLVSAKANARLWHIQWILNKCFKLWCSLGFAATPPLEPIITDAPSDENAFKFGNSNFKFKIRFIKKWGIVWESAELVSEK